MVFGLFLTGLSTPAVADDASLRAAGKSRDSHFAALGKKTRLASRAWQRSGFSARRARRVIRLLRATRVEIRVVSRAVERAQPSTPGGATYKRLFFKSMRAFERQLRFDERAVRARTAGDVGRAQAYLRRSRSARRSASRYESQAIGAIESGL